MGCCGVESEKPEMMGSFKKWEVEDAFRDIERAKMHEDNSDLMEQVKVLAKKKVKAISSIADLKRKKKELSEPDEE